MTFLSIIQKFLTILRKTDRITRSKLRTVRRKKVRIVKKKEKVSCRKKVNCEIKSELKDFFPCCSFFLIKNSETMSCNSEFFSWILGLIINDNKFWMYLFIYTYHRIKKRNCKREKKQLISQFRPFSCNF